MNSGKSKIFFSVNIEESTKSSLSSILRFQEVKDLGV